MAKKKVDLGVSKKADALRIINFPELSLKTELECRVLLEDQILLIDGFLSPAECKNFVKFIDELPLELTPPKKRGEADRFNHRFSVTSLEFAAKLYVTLTPHLPSFPYPISSRRTNASEAPRTPHSCNSNIRVYKYTPLQHFGPHYDDAVRDTITGAKSEWTLLIYLTGVEDGVEGGETVFYKDERGKSRETITAPLTRGTALLHRHGQECMLHEGSVVLKGNKYVLRSDLMFTI
ncbi:hypothetical protein BDZ94DRAFT_1251606 [Collybia nuda]|uniref:Fe2OG dioxygenase domain-containing protein n=1 Tax=Collybia nuda TaxID=64659 RepID=A0A9P5YEC5_9AGAR|nr:hypothetical protein BDZ94DRAFT_1251606 [Collybia nuda]